MPERIRIFSLERYCYIPDRYIRRNGEDLLLTLIAPARETILDYDTREILLCKEEIRPSSDDEQWDIPSLRECIDISELRDITLTRELIEIVCMDDSPISRIVSYFVISKEKWEHGKMIVRRRRNARKDKFDKYFYKSIH